MMRNTDQDLIRWRWHRALKELHLVLAPGVFAKHAVPPADLFQKIVDTMRVREQHGEIVRTEVHRWRVTRTWEVAARTPPAHELVLVVASGQGPLPKGVVIERPVRGIAESVALLTLGGDPAALAAIRPEWIGILVRAEMERLDLPGRPHEPDIYAAWVRAALHREPVVRWPITAYPAEDRRTAGAAWRIRIEETSLRVDLVVETPPPSPAALWPTLQPAIESALTRIADGEGASGFCHLFRRNVMRVLREAAHGPASLGLELPLRIAAGVALGDLHDGAGGGHSTRLSTMVSSVLTSDRLPFPGPWALANGFAFYPDERRRDEERLIAAGVAFRRLDGSPAMRANVRLAATSARSKWSKRIQHEALHIARSAISGISEHSRDVQAVTIGLKEGRLPLLLELLRDTRHKVLALVKTDRERDAVYHFATEVFALTRVGPTDEPITRHRSFDHATWVSLMVRELIALRYTDQTPAALSARLVPAISTQAVGTAMTKLVKNGFVRLDPQSGLYVPTTKNILTEQDGGGASLARFHEDMLDLTAEAIDHADRQRAEFRSIVLAIKRESLPSVRRLFLGLFQRLIAIAEPAKEADQLFQLNLRLVPLLGTGEDTFRK